MIKPMKLVVQIPCLNEEAAIERAIRSIPQSIPGIDTIEVVVIDDGSTDRTVERAKLAGAHHVVSLAHTVGLGQAFMIGLEEALKLKADIIVNFDGDCQYDGADIGKLIAPVLHQKAEIVIGDRQIGTLKHFGFAKRKLEQLGTFFVSTLTGLKLRDAVSGFRAFSQEAALRVNIRNRFSHTLETIIFAAKERLPLLSVPVTAHPTKRLSKLAPNTWSFAKKSVSSLIRAYLIYEPFKVFLSIGSLSLFVGSLPMIRFFYFFLNGNPQGHIQSLIIGSLLMILGLIFVTIGMIADLLSINRSLIEKQLLETKRMKLGL